MFLSIFDLLLSFGGGLTYGLPILWPYYQEIVFPIIAPTLSASVHIFLLISVYTTVIISLERYIRICYLCQMRSVDFDFESRLRSILICLVVFPTLFYVPKFFEYKLVNTKVYFTKKINCSIVFDLALDQEWISDENKPSDLKDCLKNVS